MHSLMDVKHLSLNTTRPIAESTRFNNTTSIASSKNQFMWGKPNNGKSPNRNTMADANRSYSVSPETKRSDLSKIDPRVYADVHSKGLASRIVKYHENSSMNLQRCMSLTNLSSKPGKFPIVHLRKKQFHYTATNQPVSMTRIPPPDKSFFYGNTLTSLLRSNSVLGLHSNNDDELSCENRPILHPPSMGSDISPTRSVLDALKEISRKRINSDETDNEVSKKYCSREFQETPSVVDPRSQHYHRQMQMQQQLYSSPGLPLHGLKRHRETGGGGGGGGAMHPVMTHGLHSEALNGDLNQVGAEEQSARRTQSQQCSPEQLAKKRLCTYNNDITSSLSSSRPPVNKRKLSPVATTTANHHRNESKTSVDELYNQKEKISRYQPAELTHIKRLAKAVHLSNQATVSTRVPTTTLPAIPDVAAEKIQPSIDADAKRSPIGGEANAVHGIVAAQRSSSDVVPNNVAVKPKITLFNKTPSDTVVDTSLEDRAPSPIFNACAGIQFVKPKKSTASRISYANSVIERTKKSKLALMLSGLRGEIYHGDDIDGRETLNKNFTNPSNIVLPGTSNQNEDNKNKQQMLNAVVNKCDIPLRESNSKSDPNSTASPLGLARSVAAAASPAKPEINKTASPVSTSTSTLAPTSTPTLFKLASANNSSIQLINFETPKASIAPMAPITTSFPDKKAVVTAVTAIATAGTAAATSSTTVTASQPMFSFGTKPIVASATPPATTMAAFVKTTSSTTSPSGSAFTFGNSATTSPQSSNPLTSDNHQTAVGKPPTFASQKSMFAITTASTPAVISSTTTEGGFNFKPVVNFGSASANNDVAPPAALQVSNNSVVGTSSSASTTASAVKPMFSFGTNNTTGIPAPTVSNNAFLGKPNNPIAPNAVKSSLFALPSANAAAQMSSTNPTENSAAASPTKPFTFGSSAIATNPMSTTFAGASPSTMQTFGGNANKTLTFNNIQNSVASDSNSKPRTTTAAFVFGAAPTATVRSNSGFGVTGTGSNFNFGSAVSNNSNTQTTANLFAGSDNINNNNIQTATNIFAGSNNNNNNNSTNTTTNLFTGSNNNSNTPNAANLFVGGNNNNKPNAPNTTQTAAAFTFASNSSIMKPEPVKTAPSAQIFAFGSSTTSATQSQTQSASNSQNNEVSSNQQPTKPASTAANSFTFNANAGSNSPANVSNIFSTPKASNSVAAPAGTVPSVGMGNLFNGSGNAAPKPAFNFTANNMTAVNTGTDGNSNASQSLFGVGNGGLTPANNQPNAMNAFGAAANQNKPFTFGSSNTTSNLFANNSINSSNTAVLNNSFSFGTGALTKPTVNAPASATLFAFGSNANNNSNNNNIIAGTSNPPTFNGFGQAAGAGVNSTQAFNFTTANTTASPISLSVQQQQQQQLHQPQQRVIKRAARRLAKS